MSNTDLNGVAISATIDPNASRTHCIKCYSEIPAQAPACKVCRAPQKPVRYCRICTEPMPTLSVRCGACQAFRGWRRIFPVSTTVLPMMVALCAVISNMFTAGSYLSDHESHTSFKVTSIDAKVLHLKVWNTGRKPSRLVGYRLRVFGQLMIDDATLDQADGDAVIQPGNSANVGVTVKELLRSRLGPGSEERHTKDEIKAQLADPTKPLMLQVEVDVEESGRLWSVNDQPFVVTKADKVSADRIKNFILGRIPDVG
jgi:hypothetical protein